MKVTKFKTINVDIRKGDERMKKIKKYYKKAMSKAEIVYRNPEEVDGMEEKAMRIVFSSEQLMSLVQDIKDLFGYIRNALNGNYRDYSKTSVLKAIGAILYLLWPADAIPDCIPVAGLVDDAAVVAYILGQIREEIDRYRCWAGALIQSNRKKG